MAGCGGGGGGGGWGGVGGGGGAGHAAFLPIAVDLPLPRTPPPLRPEPIALELADVVQGQFAPERAGVAAGGAIFAQVVEQFGEGLLAQRAAYSAGGSGNRAISPWTVDRQRQDAASQLPALMS